MEKQCEFIWTDKKKIDEPIIKKADKADMEKQCQFIWTDKKKIAEPITKKQEKKPSPVDNTASIQQQVENSDAGIEKVKPTEQNLDTLQKMIERSTYFPKQNMHIIKEEEPEEIVETIVNKVEQLDSKIPENPLPIQQPKAPEPKPSEPKESEDSEPKKRSLFRQRMGG